MQSDYAYQKKEKRSSSADSLSDDEQRDHYKTKIIQKESKIMKKQNRPLKIQHHKTTQKLFSHHIPTDKHKKQIFRAQNQYYKLQNRNKSHIKQDHIKKQQRYLKKRQDQQIQQQENIIKDQYFEQHQNQQDYSEQIVQQSISQNIQQKQIKKIYKNKLIIDEQSQNRNSIKKQPYFRHQKIQINKKINTKYIRNQKQSKVTQKILSEQNKRFKCQSECKLAQIIIQRILQKNTDHLQQYSLRDRILKQIHEEKNVCQTAKQKLSAYFIEGILIDDKKACLYSQQRVANALNKPNKLQKRLVFFPSYFVTSQMFQQIEQHTLDNMKKYVLLSGEYGYSKTFSVLLYSQLTNFIINYRVNYPNDFKQLSQKKKYCNIINRPKVFYWTINIDQAEKNQFSFIKNNSDQIFNKIKYKKIKVVQKQQYSNIQILKKYNALGIKTFLFCDQINQIASILRQNYYLKQYKNIINAQKQQSYHKLNKYGKIFLSCLAIKNQLTSYFHKVLYLSSVDIQQNNILKCLNLNQNSKHSQIEKIRLRFTQKIYKNQNNEYYEIIDFFIFQFSTKILKKNLLKNWQKNINSNTIKGLRDKLVQYLKNKNGEFYINHLIIRQYFKNQYKNQKINVQNIEQLYTILLKQFQVCINFFSFQKLKEKINQFLDKQTQLFGEKQIKIKLLIQIYITILKNYINGQINQTKIHLQIKNQQFRKIIDSKLTKQFFQFKNISSDMIQIKLMCSIALLRKIFKCLFIEEQIQNDLKCVARKVMDDFFKIFKNHQLGTTFEVILIASLLSQNCLLTITQNNKIKRYHFSIKTETYSFRAIPLKRRVKKLIINSQKNQQEKTQEQEQQEQQQKQQQEQQQQQKQQQEYIQEQQYQQVSRQSLQQEQQQIKSSEQYFSQTQKYSKQKSKKKVTIFYD